MVCTLCFFLKLTHHTICFSVKHITMLVLCSGWLLIAEVKSRFDPNTGGADPKKFSKAVCELGFTSVFKVYSCSSHIFA
jgi:ribosomal RNA-processing protein 8